MLKPAVEEAPEERTREYHLRNRQRTPDGTPQGERSPEKRYRQRSEGEEHREDSTPGEKSREK